MIWWKSLEVARSIWRNNYLRWNKKRKDLVLVIIKSLNLNLFVRSENDEWWKMTMERFEGFIFFCFSIRRSSSTFFLRKEDFSMVKSFRFINWPLIDVEWVEEDEKKSSKSLNKSSLISSLNENREWFNQNERMNIEW